MADEKPPKAKAINGVTRKVPIKEGPGRPLKAIGPDWKPGDSYREHLRQEKARQDKLSSSNPIAKKKTKGSSGYKKVWTT